jgi:hypothetical protein
MARYIRFPSYMENGKFMYFLLARARIENTTAPSSVTQGADSHE